MTRASCMCRCASICDCCGGLPSRASAGWRRRFPRLCQRRSRILGLMLRCGETWFGSSKSTSARRRVWDVLNQWKRMPRTEASNGTEVSTNVKLSSAMTVLYPSTFGHRSNSFENLHLHSPSYSTHRRTFWENRISLNAGKVG